MPLFHYFLYDFRELCFHGFVVATIYSFKVFFRFFSAISDFVYLAYDLL